MRATIQRKEASNRKWIIPLILAIISILVEIFVGDYLFFKSYKSIIGVQDFLNNSIHLSIFDNSFEIKNKDNKTNITLLYFEEEGNNDLKKDGKDGKDIEGDIKNFVKEVDRNIIFSEAIHFFNTNTFYIGGNNKGGPICIVLNISNYSISKSWYAESSNFIYNSVYSICKDNNGNIWIGGVSGADNNQKICIVLDSNYNIKK